LAAHSKLPIRPAACSAAYHKQCKACIVTAQHTLPQLHAVTIKTVNWYSPPEQVISQLRGVTCCMGSHSVTCHPTQVNSPRLNPTKQAGNSIYL